ncbi:hypothetical protein F5Y04DRAFT_284408 [Hypomontagnella monticulosa]|nr:hypothetical protein F5Y04DRAFT_284408 [Hypomontagnella monticulosa]
MAAAGFYTGVQIGTFEGMGQGVYTTQPIKRGTIVSWEEGILILPDTHTLKQYCEAYHAMTPENLNLLHSLYCDQRNRQEMNQPRYSHYFQNYFRLRVSPSRININLTESRRWVDRAKDAYAIWLTNAAAIDDEITGVFPKFSRINHSCDPNVIWVPRREGDKCIMEVQAVRDIEPNTQCHVTYIGEIPGGTDFEVRQSLLAKNWHFLCKCDRCVKEEEAKISALIGNPNTAQTAETGGMPEAPASSQTGGPVPQTGDFQGAQPASASDVHSIPVTPTRNPDPSPSQGVSVGSAGPSHSLQSNPRTPSRVPVPSPSHSQGSVSPAGPRGDALLEYRVRGGSPSPKKSPRFES